MGCKPSPVAAIIRVFMFEKHSIYIDVHYLPLLYSRYVDDAATLAESEEHAQEIFNKIAEQDPDNRLVWEVDFPDSADHFTPFLGTQIKIDSLGTLHHKYYRKEQKKQITLNFKSHHPLRTKVEVAKNFYRTARISSSNPEYLAESYGIVDHLLRCNGYSDPRQYINYNLKSVQRKPGDSNTKTVCLKLPYISENISNEILRFMKNKALPITVVFLPGKKLKDLFCSSRPYDKRKCTISPCRICSKLPDGTECSIMCPIYLINCKLCGQQYVGESCRSLHERLGEHLRYATNPDTPSYKDEALAVHYRQHHPGLVCDLSFELLRTETNTIFRKIYEALYIYNIKPVINDKDECKLVQRFLVKT